MGHANSIVRLPSGASSKKTIRNLFFSSSPDLFFRACFFICELASSISWRGRGWQPRPYKNKPMTRPASQQTWPDCFSQPVFFLGGAASSLSHGGAFVFFELAEKNRPVFSGLFSFSLANYDAFLGGARTANQQSNSRALKVTEKCPTK